MTLDPDQRGKAFALARKLALSLVAAAFVFAAAAAAVLYGIKDQLGKSGAAAQEASVDCPAARAVNARVAPLARGQVAALSLPRAPRAAPEISFNGPNGARKNLSDFRGKTVLLNLWATWCIPCRAEMPALDALQASLGDRGFEVVAINIDTARLDRPKAFLAEVKADHLTYFADPAADAFQTLRAAYKFEGLPATLLLDKDGCEIGLMAGPANWASEDALALVRAAKGS